MLTISNVKVFTHTLESSLDEAKEQGVIYPLQPSQQAIGAFSRYSPSLPIPCDLLVRTQLVNSLLRSLLIYSFH